MFNFSSHPKTTLQSGRIAVLGLAVCLHLSLTHCGVHRKVDQSLTMENYTYGVGSGARLENPVLILETDPQRAKDAIHAWLRKRFVNYKVETLRKTCHQGRHIQRWQMRIDYVWTDVVYFDVTASRQENGAP